MRNSRPQSKGWKDWKLWFLILGTLVMGYLLVSPALNRTGPQSKQALDLWRQLLAAQRASPPVRLVVRLELPQANPPVDIRATLTRSGKWGELAPEQGALASTRLLTDGLRYWSATEEPSSLRLPSLPLPEREAQLLLNYRIEAGKQSQLAGRSVREFTIRPVTPGQPSERLWRDEINLLVLKRERRSATGQVVFRLETIAYQPLDSWEPEKELANSMEAPLHKPLAQSELEQTLGIKLLAPASLPEGYKLEGFYLNYCAGQPVAESRYTNGLSHLALFQSKPGQPCASADVFGQTISVEVAGQPLLVAGELGEAALRQFAMSAR